MNGPLDWFLGVLCCIGGVLLFAAGMWAVWTTPEVTTAGALALTGIQTFFAAVIIALVAEAAQL